MNILVVNDDGWCTAGIRLLAKEMTRLGHVTDTRSVHDSYVIS